jgi:thymidylate kinase
MNSIVVDQPSRQRPPLIIELVGPAGAGKTTLSRALKHRSPKIQIGAEIELRKIHYIPIFIRNALLLLPIILYRWHYSRWFTWEEIKYLIYLRGWPRILKHQALQGGDAILLDHGPVFKLATLNGFGPVRLQTKGFGSWWNKMFKEWASIVDIVIWLDAPDPVLEQRINSRNQRHAVKGKSEFEVLHFLARYRTSYEQILAKWATYGEPILFQFDTSQTTIEQVADEVLRTINSYHEEPERTVEFA